MNEKQAYAKVKETFDDDHLSDVELVDLFTAIYGRKPDADERGDMWSLIASATPGLCGCSTRREHESKCFQDRQNASY